MKKITIWSSALALALVALPAGARLKKEVIDSKKVKCEVRDMDTCTEDNTAVGVVNLSGPRDASFVGYMDGFIKDNLRYPESDKSVGREGTVMVRCFIERDGSIIDAYPTNTVSSTMDLEAVRVVKSMPDWIPALDANDMPVISSLIIPVRFSLTHESEETQIIPSDYKNEIRDQEDLKKEKRERRKVYSPSKEDLEHIKAVKKSVVIKNPIEPVEDDEVFQTVTEQAQFPGGLQALMNYLGANIQYPEEAWRNNIEGRVIIKFVIEKDGRIGDILVINGVDPSLDRESIRVVSGMPTWIPGKLDGVPVRCWFHIPITFRIPKEEEGVTTK